MTLNEMCLLMIKSEEGFRSEPYYCSEGYPTIGYGRVIGAKGSSLSIAKANEQTESEWVDKEINQLISSLKTHNQVVWEMCNTARKAVLVSMAYQLGFAGLSGFKMALASIAGGDYDSAAIHMLDSKWAKQTPNRAARHAEQMQTGNLLNYYGA